MRLAIVGVFALALFAVGPVVWAQTFPVHIPTSNGDVILASERDRQEYDAYGFAPVRRAGDLVFISGIVAGRRPGDGTDVKAFKTEVRRAFRALGGELKAAGVGFEDVVMLNTFHVWQGPNFRGSRLEQFEAFKEVKGEFMKPPHPAWTAVGTTGEIPDGGIVEIQMIAKASR